MTTTDVTLIANANPGKKFRLSNFCPYCGKPVPPDKDFCCDEHENNFYDESELERMNDEGLAEREELEREERKEKAGLFKEEL